MSFSPSTLTRHPFQLHGPWPALAVQDLYPLAPGRAPLHLLTGTLTWHEPKGFPRLSSPRLECQLGLPLFMSLAWSPVVDQKTILE